MQTREEKKQYLKERREWLHQHHFCTSCKKQDARTLMGKWECYECSQKNRMRKSGLKYTRQERKEFGLCSICGKVAKDGFNVCEDCYARLKKARDISHINHKHRPPVDRDSNPKLPRYEWVANGYCRTCGDKAMDGYKVCEKCRQHLTEISRKQIGQRSFWRETMNFTSNF